MKYFAILVIICKLSKASHNMDVRGIEDKNMPLPEFLHYLHLIQSKPGSYDKEAENQCSKIKPLKEFLASSVAGGSIFKMDVTHQQATKSALESGKLLGTNNFANMDMFKWYALNDNVMGGVSNGNVTKNDANNLSFWGKLSSENRGGFASCRTEIETGLLDGYAGLSFMARGDNREYSALVTPYQSNSGVNYQLKFVAPTEWTRIDIPFDQMYMSIRGFHPPVYPKITGDKVHKIGLLIADKNFADKFNIEVESITGFK